MAIRRDSVLSVKTTVAPPRLRGDGDKENLQADVTVHRVPAHLEGTVPGGLNILGNHT